LILGVLKLRIDWDGISIKECYDKWISQAPEFATLPTLLIWQYLDGMQQGYFLKWNPFHHFSGL
jgi:hypothetical protein